MLDNSRLYWWQRKRMFGSSLKTGWRSRRSTPCTQCRSIWPTKNNDSVQFIYASRPGRSCHSRHCPHIYVTGPSFTSLPPKNTVACCYVAIQQKLRLRHSAYSISNSARNDHPPCIKSCRCSAETRVLFISANKWPIIQSQVKTKPLPLLYSFVWDFCSCHTQTCVVCDVTK